jgi:RNA polymerase sigma factor (sigma-70 family)
LYHANLGSLDFWLLVMVDKTSISLLERLRKPDDQEAWSYFVHLYTPLLYFWFRRSKLSIDETEDLVQEVFATLVHKLPGFTYDPSRRFRGWLWTVAINKLRERRRQPGSIAAGQIDPNLLEGADTIAEFTEEEYRRFITDRALQLMQKDFEPTTWRAFWEHVPNGRTAPEVAAELGISIGAVYAAKTRILGRLRNELQGLLD